MFIFQLAPFEFCGDLVQYEVSDGEPSLIFGCILAREAMMDPQETSEILETFGCLESAQSIFERMATEFQQLYLFGELPLEFFYKTALEYEKAYPNPELRDLVRFAEANPPEISFDFSPALGDQARARLLAKQNKKKAKKKQKTAQKSRTRNRK